MYKCRRSDSVLDVIFVALTLALFAVLTVIVRAAEHL